MPGISALSLRDVRAVAAEIINASSLPPNSAELQEKLLSSVSRLLGASGAIACAIHDLLPGRLWRASRIDQVGMDKSLRLILDYQELELRDDPSEHVFRQLDGSHVVATRQQLVPDDQWYSSPHVMEVRRAWDVDHCLYSMIYLDEPGRAKTLAVFRPWGDKTPFSVRDAALLEVLHFSIVRIENARKQGFQSGFGRSHTQLSPREVEVLASLQQGLSEKEVAAELRMSVHTAHAHVASLYRSFNVHSRAELLAHTLGPASEVFSQQSG